MTRTEIQIQLTLAEVAQSHTRARHFELRLMTGAYKERVGKVYRGPISDGVLMTEGEIALDEVRTHDAHIRRAEDLLDHAKRLLATIPAGTNSDSDEVVEFGGAHYPGRHRV